MGAAQDKVSSAAAKSSVLVNAIFVLRMVIFLSLKIKNLSHCNGQGIDVTFNP